MPLSIEHVHSVIMGIHAGNPKDLPIKILEVYLNNVTAARWAGDSDIVDFLNERADAEAAALRKAIEILKSHMGTTSQ